MPLPLKSRSGGWALVFKAEKRTGPTLRWRAADWADQEGNGVGPPTSLAVLNGKSA